MEEPREPEDLSADELQEGILGLLQGRPNQACKKAALTRLLVAHLGLRKVRGERRERLDRRVSRALGALKRRTTGVRVEEYRAVNVRIRLVRARFQAEMIRPPIGIPRHIRSAAEMRARELAHQQGQIDGHLLERLQHKAENMRKSRMTWVVNLGSVVEKLVTYYQLTECGAFPLDHEVKRQIVGALRYVDDRNDVIPDHATGIGFLDDVHVVNSCLSELARRGIAIHNDS